MKIFKKDKKGLKIKEELTLKKRGNKAFKTKEERKNILGEKNKAVKDSKKRKYDIVLA